MAAPFVGTTTVTERLHNDTSAIKAAVRKLSSTLRVGMPGVITAFDENTQLCSVQLTVTENVNNNGKIEQTPIQILDDVLLILPGDSEWTITFPKLVGSECYVHFADMCISAWHNSSGVQNQEVTRRHNLSDGFAVLAPRSRPNVIPDYSTDALEIRKLDGSVGISLDDTTITLNGLLATSQVAAVTLSLPNRSLPIVVDGVTMYLLLSTTP